MNYKNKNSWFINKNYLGKVILFAGGIFLAGEHVAMLDKKNNEELTNSKNIKFVEFDTLKKSYQKRKDFVRFFTYLKEFMDFLPSTLRNEGFSEIFPSIQYREEHTDQKGNCCCWTVSYEIVIDTDSPCFCKQSDLGSILCKTVVFKTRKILDVEDVDQSGNFSLLSLEQFLSLFFKENNNGTITFNTDAFRSKKKEDGINAYFKDAEAVMADFEKESDFKYFGQPGKPETEILIHFRNFVSYDWSTILQVGNKNSLIS